MFKGILQGSTINNKHSIYLIVEGGQLGLDLVRISQISHDIDLLFG